VDPTTATIAGEWGRLADLWEEHGHEAGEDHRRCFYAGAYSVLSLLSEMANAGTPNADYKRALAGWIAELKRWREEVAAAQN
jgi:hypothetical protein